MLKITKGLKPYVEDCIMPYTDSKGNRYVRVKMDGEDFCIATQDYTEDGKYYFTWDDAMDALKAEGLTTFTKDQALICNNNINEINDILKEINGKIIPDHEWYWTSTEYDADYAWVYHVISKHITSRSSKNGGYIYSVRPVINLLKK